MLASGYGQGPTADQLAARLPGARVTLNQSPMESTGLDEAASYLGTGGRAASGLSNLARLFPNMFGGELAGGLGAAGGGLGALSGIAGLAQGNVGSGMLGLASGGIGALNSLSNLPGFAAQAPQLASLGQAGSGLGGAGSALGQAGGALGLASTVVTGLMREGGLSAEDAVAMVPTIMAMAGGGPMGLAMAAINIGLGYALKEKPVHEIRSMKEEKAAHAMTGRLFDAIQGGNWGAEIAPGVRAGDLLATLASEGAAGTLGGDFAASGGVMPKGEYGTLAQNLTNAGYHNIGKQMKGDVENIYQLMGRMGETEGQYGRGTQLYTNLLDSLSKGLKPAFTPQEAALRSPLFNNYGKQSAYGDIGTQNAPMLWDWMQQPGDLRPGYERALTPQETLQRALQDDRLFSANTGTEALKFGGSEGLSFNSAAQGGSPDYMGGRPAMVAQAAEALGVPLPGDFYTRLSAAQKDAARRERDYMAAGGP